MRGLRDQGSGREHDGLLGKEERVVKIFDARFLLGLDVGKKLHAKFHFALRALPGSDRFSGQSGLAVKKRPLTMARRE